MTEQARQSASTSNARALTAACCWRCFVLACCICHNRVYSTVTATLLCSRARPLKLTLDDQTSKSPIPTTDGCRHLTEHLLEPRGSGRRSQGIR